MAPENITNSKQSKIPIIQTVQTPLGFFTLVVLIVEVIFGIIATFSEGSDRTYLIVGMTGLMFFLVAIVAILTYKRRIELTEVSGNIKKLGEKVEIYKDQNAANEDLIKYIENIRPKNVFMAEYSSASVEGLLSALIETRISPNIYLLIQHPKQGKLIKNQAKRICGQITEHLYIKDEFRNYPNLKILCYTQRTSFRGRNFDNKLINIGWYIYKYDTNGEQFIYGHNQPAVTFRESFEDFSDIKNMFCDTFKNLWENGISLRDVAEEIKKDEELKYEPFCSDTDFLKWCEKVSPKKGERRLEIKR